MAFTTPSELRAAVEELMEQRDGARAQLAGILVALGVDLPVPHDKALEVALDRIEELFGADPGRGTDECRA